MGTVDLRLQLLEPEKYPYLYKCLYGLLMLLPQSAAFAALKNRLNSVSAIGFLHTGPRPYVPLPATIGSTLSPHLRQGPMTGALFAYQSHPPRRSIHDTHWFSASSAPSSSTPGYDRPNRLGKGREDGIIRWEQLLDKFKSVQERARRAQRLMGGGGFYDGPDFGELRVGDNIGSRETAGRLPATGPPVPQKDPAPPPKRTGLGRQFGRLGATVAGRGKRSQQ